MRAAAALGLLLAAAPAWALRVRPASAPKTPGSDLEDYQEPEDVERLAADGIGASERSLVCQDWHASYDSWRYPISSAGGRVMSGAPTIHYVWYGDWHGSPAVEILTDLAKSIGGSAWYRTNSTYDRPKKKEAVSGQARFGSAATDEYSRGTTLGGADDVREIVRSAIEAHRLPLDENAVYFVLTSSDVELPGFCGSFCGWHTHADLGGADVKFSFVGNPARCPGSCGAAKDSTPNGHAAADAMASVLAHELAETVTDPDLDAWSDFCGWENADKCAWDFGPSNGDSNATVGKRRFWLQRNWINQQGGYCGLSLDDPPPPKLAGPKVVTSDIKKTFEYRIGATNNPSSYEAVNLPRGLILHPDTGRITGVLIEPGTYSVMLGARNEQGEDHALLTIVAVDPSLDVKKGPFGLDLGWALELGKKFKFF